MPSQRIRKHREAFSMQYLGVTLQYLRLDTNLQCFRPLCAPFRSSSACLSQCAARQVSQHRLVRASYSSYFCHDAPRGTTSAGGALRRTSFQSSSNTLDMINIQLNESGTRHLDITEENLQTIRKYDLFRQLVGSNGYVTEEVLEKLRHTIRSLIAASTTDTKDLLDLCIDVIYHDKMKAYGLRNLIAAYDEWLATQAANEEQA